MTDVMEILAAAKRDVSDEAVPPVDHVWRKLDIAAMPQDWTLRLPRSRGFQRSRPLILGSTTGAIAAAVAAIVLISAGGAPSAAQAFPILRTAAVDLRTDASVAPQGIVSSALGSAHPFAEPYGTGYVAQSPDGANLCLVIPSPSSSPTGPSVNLVVCGSTQSLEQQGAAFVVNGPAGSPDAFVALVPTGGVLTVTADNATTAVSADDGIATGLISQSETLTVQVGSSITAQQVAPNSSASTQLTPTSPRSSALTNANTLNGSTTATGPTPPTN